MYDLQKISGHGCMRTIDWTAQKAAMVLKKNINSDSWTNQVTI